MSMKRTNKRILWAVLMLLLAVGGGCSREEPVMMSTQEPGIEIPLNKIWGHGLPKTISIDILELDHLQKLSEQERLNLPPRFLMKEIYLAISRQDESQPMGSGFAVAGTGYEALLAATEIMEQDRMPTKIFPADTDVSLFFFTRALGMGFQLKKVWRSKEAVTIRYQVVPDYAPVGIEMASTYYFALIPLGRLPAGNIDVKLIEQLAKRKRGKYARRAFKQFKQSYEGSICKPFSFSIEPVNTDTASSK